MHPNLNPPRNLHYESHLRFHLFRHGTRPDREPGDGLAWHPQEFAEAMAECVVYMRRKVDRRKNREAADLVQLASKELSRCLTGEIRAPNRKWGDAIEEAFFGPLGVDENRAYREWRGLLRKARLPVQFLDAGYLYSKEDIHPGVREAMVQYIKKNPEAGWDLERLRLGEGYTNTSFNRLLAMRAPIIPLETRGTWFASDYNRPVLKDFADFDGSPFDNDPKIRLATDISPDASVVIQRTDYLSSLMTDQLAWKTVRSVDLRLDGSADVVWDGTSQFIEQHDGKFTLGSLAKVGISNQLGGSTLAFSKDGELMIVHQTPDNHQSGDKLAPSGSGSLDWWDYEKTQATDLLTLIRHGAQRELEEESALDEDGSGRRRIPSLVRVIAFTRMLHRAGKPEFFLLGLMGADSNELRERTPDRYTKELLITGVPPVDWSIRPHTREISRVCRGYLNKQADLIAFSYPLEHGLMLLSAQCEDISAAPVLDQWVADGLRTLGIVDA
jgi:hypothetical protein